MVEQRKHSYKAPDKFSKNSAGKRKKNWVVISAEEDRRGRKTLW